MTRDENVLIFQYCVEQVADASNWSVVFEDDGKTAYAYLIKGNEIRADVWLYNHGSATTVPEWNDPEKLPFTNPAEYSRSLDRLPVRVREDFDCVWHFSGTDLVDVVLLFRGEVFARLTRDSKPGESLLAVKDGPLARKLALSAATNETETR